MERKIRDQVRSLMKAHLGTVGPFASRVIGSADIYGDKDETVLKSVNFVTCHDGYTR